MFEVGVLFHAYLLLMFMQEISKQLKLNSTIFGNKVNSGYKEVVPTPEASVDSYFNEDFMFTMVVNLSNTYAFE